MGVPLSAARWVLVDIASTIAQLAGVNGHRQCRLGNHTRCRIKEDEGFDTKGDRRDARRASDPFYWPRASFLEDSCPSAKFGTLVTKLLGELLHCPMLG